MIFQQRTTVDPYAAAFGRKAVTVWTAPTLEQIIVHCPGLAQEIDGDRNYLIPYEEKLLPITYGALERLYAFAA